MHNQIDPSEAPAINFQDVIKGALTEPVQELYGMPDFPTGYLEHPEWETKRLRAQADRMMAADPSGFASSNFGPAEVIADADRHEGAIESLADRESSLILPFNYQYVGVASKLDRCSLIVARFSVASQADQESRILGMLPGSHITVGSYVDAVTDIDCFNEERGGDGQPHNAFRLDTVSMLVAVARVMDSLDNR